jgi:flagellar biosynthesis protein
MSTRHQDEEPIQAVALRYEEAAGSAPRVVAMGAGDVAERILAIANEHGVPVQADSDLVTLLSACELGAEIPFELYEAVAELLSWLYSVNAALKH